MHHCKIVVLFELRETEIKNLTVSRCLQSDQVALGLIIIVVIAANNISIFEV